MIYQQQIAEADAPAVKTEEDVPFLSLSFFSAAAVAEADWADAAAAEMIAVALSGFF